MTRRLAIYSLFTSLVAFGAGGRLLAHEGHDHRIMGTVTHAAHDHVMLTDTKGADLTVLVTKDTKVKAKTPLSVEDIETGARVVITATMAKDKSLTAKTIEVGAVPAAATKK